MHNWVGQQLGNYRLLKWLARGGFAEVYLAEHQYLKRNVAVKVLTIPLTSNIVEEFRHEAQIIAKLKHPHIIPIFDFGMADGAIPFLVMEYAINGTLEQRHPLGTLLPLPLVISYVRPIADALLYAHNTRRIHRDVKPANILLDEQNKVLLSDFGIVADAHSTASMRQIDSTGTPLYMAPEQFQGVPVVASDQYALAIVVYRWLCGIYPFQGNGYTLAHQHITLPPSPLRKHNPQLSSEVEAVVLRALSKDPKQRFPSILAFAQALEHTMQQSIPTKTAYVTSPAEKITVSPTPVSPPLRRSIPRGTTLLTYEHTGGCITIAWSPDGRFLASGGEDRTVRIWEATTGQTQFILRGHTNTVNAVAWSPDGSWLASAADDGTVRIWEVTSSGKEIVQYDDHEDSYIRAVAWSPTGQFLASSSLLSNSIHIWEATTGQTRLVLWGHTDTINAVTWSPDGHFLASGGDDRTVRVWEATSGKEVLQYNGHKDAITTVAWSPTGQLLASSSWDNTIHVWEATPSKTAQKLINLFLVDSVDSVTWSPNGQLLAIADIKGVFVREVASDKILLTYKTHKAFVDVVAWSPTGQFLASAGNRTIQIWEAPSGSILLEYTDHTAIVNTVAWSPDGKRIASAGTDTLISIREAISGKILCQYHGHEGSIKAVAWSPDGRLLASASFRTVDVWEAISGKKRFQYEHQHLVNSVAWSPDGQFLVSADEQVVDVWEATSGKMCFRYNGHTGKIQKIVWSPDGQHLASTSDETIHIWEAASGKILYQYKGGVYTTRAIAWSPDGQFLASSDINKVNVRKIASDEFFLQYEDHASIINALVWSPDGRFLASSCNDQTVHIHEISGEHHFTFKGHSGAVNTLAWSPDGKRIVSGGYEVHIWQAAFSPNEIDEIPIQYFDLIRACRKCGDEFAFTAGKQEFYAKHGLTNTPSYCPRCLAAYRKERREGE